MGLPLPPMTGQQDVLQYIGSFGLKRSLKSLGDVIVTHSGAMAEFYKLDRNDPQRILNLTFKVLPQSITPHMIDVGLPGMPFLMNRFDYIDWIYTRNRVMGIRPIIVNGPEDGVDRFYYFSQDTMDSEMMMSFLWSTGLQLTQIYYEGGDSDNPTGMPFSY